MSYVNLNDTRRGFYRFPREDSPTWGLPWACNYGRWVTSYFPH